MTDTPETGESSRFHAQALSLVEMIVQDFVNSRTNTSTSSDGTRPAIETLNIVQQQYNVSGTAGSVGPGATLQGNLLAQAWSHCSVGPDFDTRRAFGGPVEKDLAVSGPNSAF